MTKRKGKYNFKSFVTLQEYNSYSSDKYLEDLCTNLIIRRFLFIVISVLQKRNILIDKRMAKFKISAPGRIVLTGEHIALHGKTFLATSLNLRTTLEFYELPNTPKNIKIEFPNVNLYQDISLNLVKPFFSLSNVKDIISNPLNLREYVRYLITVEKCMWTAQHELYSLEIFFFLLYYIAHREHLKIKPFYIKVSTELPVAAGLGSSTSFAVCLAACFVHWKHVQSGNYNFKFDDADLESIKTYTEFCEKSTQVYAFGVDAHVCTYGKVVKCRRTDHKTYNIDSQDMEEMEKMPIILIDSKFYHSKTLRAEQIMKNAVATDFDNILNTLELQAINMFRHLKKISDMMEKSILKGESISFDYVMPHLIFLTQNNQQLLDRYKLSAEAFENVCKIARMSNLAGKLTGFGGKYVFVLTPPHITSEQIFEFMIKLRARSFNPTFTDINCSGVRIIN